MRAHSHLYALAFLRKDVPVLYVFNKIDSITIEELDILDQLPNYVPIRYVCVIVS